MTPLRHFRVAMIFAACAAHSLAQNQVDIGPTKDNTLIQDTTGSLSNGAGPNFFVGKNSLGSNRRGVLAFDISGNVPPGIAIDSVMLTLFMSQTTSADETIELHRLLADWGEGTSSSTGGMGAPATPGDATWIHTFYDTLFWVTPGGDFSTTVSASRSVGAIGFYVWGSTSQMVADVQGWLDNPSGNFGWLALGNESMSQTTKRFETRENPVPANRPILSVFWTGPASADEPHPFPQRFELGQNYPNPFNPETTIEYALKENQFVSLKIYNTLGQEISTLVNEFQAAGYKTVIWNGMNETGAYVSSGVYIYRITAGEFAASRKMLFLR